MIKKENMEIISLEELFNKDHNQSIIKDLKQDYKFLGKIIPKLVLESKCTHFSWVSQFSLFNQALTGFTYGLLWGLKSYLINFLTNRIIFKNKALIMIEPQFSQKGYNKSELKGIFNCKLGNIILMVGYEIFYKIKGGV